MVSGFGPPEPVNKAAWRSASGRVCDRQGCSTILSTYNASGTCWLHTEPAYQHPLYRA
jgi:hypothetical protein